ncbi:Guanine nucleotide-binding protein alpha-1 subunit [Grifola frondosa]|uniref:Guanine nucleotide-binding protein alpha-1 subunit n=1 Tax=Grifola frondosa TaxID=5627 RepID=A0A1C7MS49_GRIFR|nr:Guanine nucleotide-binding protein alpha-1 subunit [Grifola frondosa]
MLVIPTRDPPDRDPLSAALRPPIDETEEEKASRVAEEDEAKRVSQAIDESIRMEKQQRKKQKVVRLLLLGQSESGKSTTLRQFQRLYTPSAFREERVLWRAVIQLNIVRSIRTMLDAVTDVRRGDLLPSASYTSDPDSDSETESHISLPPRLEHLCARLRPLRHIEAMLIAKLVPPNEHEATHLGMTVNGYGTPNGLVYGNASAAFLTDVTVPQPRGVYLIALWRDPMVKQILRRRKIRLEESPGFYLNDLERVTALYFLPSDDDVLKARLKTVGVSEYRFEMEAGSESGAEWRIIDVGGSRSQRPMWVPFFDDVDAIIFLAPISGFDQTLVEDRSVNRLEDSVVLWKAVCSNKLLAKVDLVLFLNKCDILSAKLSSGVRLAKYVRSFGERPNDAETAQKYFRSKFNAIHREYSPLPRKFYGFCTSVTDTTTTGGILASVRDMVIREHLRASKLL